MDTLIIVMKSKVLTSIQTGLYQLTVYHMCHGRRNLERFEECSNCFREGIPYAEGDQKNIINTATRKADGVDMEMEREEDIR